MTRLGLSDQDSDHELETIQPLLTVSKKTADQVCDSPDIEAQGLQSLQAKPVVANAREEMGPASDSPVRLRDSTTHSQSET